MLANLKSLPAIDFVGSKSRQDVWCIWHIGQYYQLDRVEPTSMSIANESTRPSMVRTTRGFDFHVFPIDNHTNDWRSACVGCFDCADCV